MAILHWALKDILYEVTATGVEIKVFTFHPCHLWLRWTTEDPQEHLVPVIRRGVAIHSDRRFCFVAYHDNEQSEGNDTYVHTFLKEPWPVCETRYFYFHGRMGGERSKSTSAIFSYHRFLPPPPPSTIRCEPTGLATFMSGGRCGEGFQYKFTPGETFIATKVTLEAGRAAGYTTPDYIQFRLYNSQADGRPLGSPLRTSQAPPPPPDWPIRHTLEFPITPITLEGGTPYSMGWCASEAPSLCDTVGLHMRDGRDYTCEPAQRCWRKICDQDSYFFWSYTFPGFIIYGYVP